MINETTETLELACYSATLELSLLLARTAELGSLEQVVSTEQDKQQRCGMSPRDSSFLCPLSPPRGRVLWKSHIVVLSFRGFWVMNPNTCCFSHEEVTMQRFNQSPRKLSLIYLCTLPLCSSVGRRHQWEISSKRKTCGAILFSACSCLFIWFRVLLCHPDLSPNISAIVFLLPHPK